MVGVEFLNIGVSLPKPTVRLDSNHHAFNLILLSQRMMSFKHNGINFPSSQNIRWQYTRDIIMFKSMLCEVDANTEQSGQCWGYTCKYQVQVGYEHGEFRLGFLKDMEQSKEHDSSEDYQHVDEVNGLLSERLLLFFLVTNCSKILAS